MRGRWRSPILAAAAVAGLAAGALGCVADAEPDATPTTTRGADQPAGPPPSPGPPGQLITAREAPPPTGGRAWVLDLHGRSVTGEDVAQRAMLVVPMVAPPPDGFPLVVWGHATRGGADHCAPSAQGPTAIPLVDDLVGAGYAVVAPDYEGLGAVGPHPYLVGESEGRSMLDAARAATQVKGSGVRSSSPVVLWGFSQGGHAAAFAADLAPTWAPEVRLVGVAMAAPVADVSHFVARAEGWPEQVGLLASVVGAYDVAYPELAVDRVLTEPARRDLEVLEKECIAEVNAFFNRPVDQVVAAPPRTDPAWAARMDANLAGRHPIAVPVLVIQGELDQIVDPADTVALVERYCANGVPVAYLVRPGENHGVLSSDVLRPWIRGRLVGDQPPDTCAEPGHRG